MDRRGKKRPADVAGISRAEKMNRIRIIIDRARLIYNLTPELPRELIINILYHSYPKDIVDEALIRLGWRERD